LFILIKKNLTI